MPFITSDTAANSKLRLLEYLERVEMWEMEEG